MTTWSLPDRLYEVRLKATSLLADSVDAMRAGGLDPISLATARPNFDTPAVIKEALVQAISEQHLYMTYTESRGLLELRKSVSDKLLRKNHLAYEAETQILITAGTHEALYTGLQALVQPDDEVLLIDPSWTAYQGMVRLAGATPVMVPLREGRLDPAKLDSLITNNTRVMVLNNPNNPTGTVFTLDELKKIAALAIKHNLFMLVDEIYEEFIFDGREHVCLASLPGMQERTLLINGFSKAYAMTGWRVGYAAGPEWLIDRMLIIHQHLISAPTSFAQKGAVAAYTYAGNTVREMVNQYRIRRDRLQPLLNGLPRVSASLPEGACFYFLRIDSHLSSLELSRYLAEEVALLITPGSAFGPTGENHLRFSFAGLSLELIPEVIQRLHKALEGLDD